MNEQFRRNKLWLGLAVAAILFLCVMLCGLGALVTMGARSSTVYLPPPTGGEGSAPPPLYQSSPSPWGLAGGANTGPFSFLFGAVGFLFKVAFLGLGLLLFLGLVKRLFWGPRHGWAHVGPRPPHGSTGSGQTHARHGPWAWHACGGGSEAEDEPSDETGMGPTETSYNGPQE
jgi:hypothetical protein